MRFLAWMQKFSPEMAAAVSERIGEAPKAGPLNQLGEAWDMFYPSMYYGGTGYRGRWHTQAEHLSGLGQDVDPWGGIGVSTTSTTTTNGTTFDWASDLFTFAKEAIPAYLAYDAQKDIMDLNLERAKQGLDPIDPGVVAPQVRVVHDFPPEVQQQISAFKMGGMNILLWGGLAVAAFFVVRMIR
jgi:hypothetical protein